MKEIPILFSTPMVQAIIADRKTETRRTRGLDLINKNPDDWELKGFGGNPSIEKDRRPCAYFNKKESDTWTYVISPYGKPGNLLWVRETFILQDGIYKYLADNTDWKGIIKFKPSIHMPKTAARVWLKVIDIKVERLEYITETSAIAEGVQIGKGLDNSNWYLDYQTNLFQLFKAKSSFNTLWRKINGEDSYNSNPWVWVVKFEVVSKNGKPIINQ